MENENVSKQGKQNLYAIVAILAAGSIAYRLMMMGDYGQTSILFVGLPALITILMIKYSKRPKSAYGVVFRVITLFLLMSSVVLGEGIICILMAAPIFYGVAALIVFLITKSRENKIYSVIGIPLVICLFQPFGIKTEPKVQVVQNSAVYFQNISIKAFNKQPDLTLDYPTFFKMGFPKPLSIEGKGCNIGDARDIQFKSSTRGVGALSLEIVESSGGYIKFIPRKDNTHINRWLTWIEMEVEFKKIDNNQTKVVWTSRYTCDLGPQWYFEPIQRYTVEMMNEYLMKLYFN